MNKEMSNDYPHPSSSASIAPQCDPRPMEDDGKPDCDSEDLTVSNMMQMEEVKSSSVVLAQPEIVTNLRKKRGDGKPNEERNKKNHQEQWKAHIWGLEKLQSLISVALSS